MADIIGIPQHILGIAAVDEVAGVAPLLAHRLPAGHAEFALAAGVVQPRHADQIALLDVGDAGPECRDGADALVTGNQGQLRLHRPIAVHGVQVGVADTTRRHLDQYLARPGRGYGHILDHERVPELVHACRLHRFRHGLVLHVFVIGRLFSHFDFASQWAQWHTFAKTDRGECPPPGSRARPPPAIPCKSRLRPAMDRFGIASKLSAQRSV